MRTVPISANTASIIFLTWRRAAVHAGSGKSIILNRVIWAIPCFDTAFAKVGVYICYDRHFPEGARALGLERSGDCV